MARLHRNHELFVRRLVAYADNHEPGENTEFVIPEDLTALTDEELTALHEQAVTHFDTVFGDGTGLTDADVAALAVLTEGIEALQGEVAVREAQAAERADAAAALAARAHPASDEVVEGELVDETDDEDDLGPENDENDPDAPPTPSVENADEPLPIAASAARREIRVNLGTVRSRANTRVPAPRAVRAESMRDIVLASGDGGGFTSGQGLDWMDMGRIVDRQLASFNATQYANAARAGKHLSQQNSLAVIRKPFGEDLILQSNDPEHVDTVLHRAMDEHRLPGGSLTASGTGWCAPSVTIYDLCELESRDGLVSVPEVGIVRGGISWTTGPSFSDIYNATGFCFTEQDDIDGDYDGAGSASTKPCYHVDCPDFEEARLEACGLCITAGLLQQRGYPEMISRTVRGGLVAHDHKMSANTINAIIAGSTAITMPQDVGALAPLLTAIELQVEHIRYTERMARNTTMEAVFPYWVHGAIRTDLSYRLGVNLVDVTDAQVDAWFRSRGISPQYVYDWQDLNTVAATAFVKWPATVKFLLYPAGTWVRGTSDIITMDTIYDSVLLGTNDFTALFTEEGWLLAKMCRDSRVVTVNLCADGATAAGVLIGCDGKVSATV